MKKICKGIAINKENSLLLLDSIFVITVFALKNGIIKKLALLKSHS